jgi:hypothetical protein
MVFMHRSVEEAGAMRFLRLLAGLLALGLACTAHSSPPPPPAQVHEGNVVEVPAGAHVQLAIDGAAPMTVPTFPLGSSSAFAVPAMPYLGKSLTLLVQSNGVAIRTLELVPQPERGSTGAQTLALLDLLASLPQQVKAPTDPTKAAAYNQAASDLAHAVVTARALVVRAQTNPVVLGKVNDRPIVLSRRALVKLDAVIAGALEPELLLSGSQAATVSPKDEPVGQVQQADSAFLLTTVVMVGADFAGLVTSPLWVWVAGFALAVDAASLLIEPITALANSAIAAGDPGSSPVARQALAIANAVAGVVAQATQSLAGDTEGGPLSHDTQAAADDSASPPPTPPACPTGQVLCSTACTDLFADELNCGACGQACAPDQWCCNGACDDVMTDSSNCGQCSVQGSNACAQGVACSGGQCNGCSPPCPQGSSCCSGGCVDTQNDPLNCGGCDMACDPSRTCVGGTCQPGCSANCAEDEECIGGRCEALDCDTTGCPPGEDCIACLGTHVCVGPGSSCCGIAICAPTDQCVNGSCQTCGHAGEPCCPPASGECNPNLTCVNGTCVVESCSGLKGTTEHWSSANLTNNLQLLRAGLSLNGFLGVPAQDSAHATVVFGTVKAGYAEVSVTLDSNTCCYDPTTPFHCTDNVASPWVPVPPQTEHVVIRSNGDPTTNSFGTRNCSITECPAPSGGMPAACGADPLSFSYGCCSEVPPGQSGALPVNQLQFDFTWNLPAACGGPLKLNAFVQTCPAPGKTTNSCW